MKELDLRFYPDPVLRERSDAIESFDDELRELAEAMVATMRREKGIGLAAPQVGLTKRLIVALQMKEPEDVDAEPLVLVNPRVVSTGGELWSYEEGCLSIPGVSAAVLRPSQVGVEYQGLDGEIHKIVEESMLGRILLHEIDHLDGKLFIDYLSSAQKSLLKSQLKDLASGKRPS
ncbi:MAG: peptide deformylase [Candidatus Krumholzibacteriia bacterium]